MWKDQNIERASGSNLHTYPYERGFYCGRFQHIHIGHQHVIDIGLHMCKKLLIVVGSAQESATERNPFTAAFRIELIKKVYREEVESGRLVVIGVNDYTHENDLTPLWGKHLLNHVTDALGGEPNIMLYGMDEGRELWFDPEDIKCMARMLIPRGASASATELRKAVLRGDFDYWSKFVDPRIHKQFVNIQYKLVHVPYYKEVLRNG